MAFTIPNLSGASYDDQAFPGSTDIDILVNGFTGDGVVSGCATTAQGTPDMTVHVASGSIYWNGASVSVTAADPTITTASSNPRRDLVYVTSTGSVGVAAGTPQAPDASDPSVVPVLPAVPANSIGIAAVDVPANATSITAGMIIDKRIGSVGEYAAGLAQSKDATFFRQAGTSPLERWYPVGYTHAINWPSTSGISANTFYAYPYLSGRGGTLDRIAVHASGSGVSAHVGIYTATSDSNLYPDDLVYDSGAVALSGTTTVTLSQALNAHKLYWFTLLFNGTGINMYYMPGAYIVALPVLAYSSGAVAMQYTSLGLTVAQTYGSLPATFPGSAAVTGTLYVMTVRYSA